MDVKSVARMVVMMAAQMVGSWADRLEYWWVCLQAEKLAAL